MDRATDMRHLAGPPAPLRVLVFLHSFDPGGVERVALRLAGAWAAAGCEVTVAMGRAGGALESERPAGVTFDFAPPNPQARRYESLWLTPHLVGAVRRRRPDVLFCAGNTYAVVAVLARAILGRRCPPIVAKVSNSLDRRDFGFAMRRLYALWLRVQALFIDRFVGMAEAMREEIAAALDAPPERLAIVHDPALSGADLARSASLGRQAGRGAGRLFVAVGRLAPQKDFGLAIRAFARIAGGGDRLAILGEGPEGPRLRRLAAALGVADRLDLPGHVADVGPWLARADAFVLSSRYEGVPAAVIEALAVGAPIVATDCTAAMRDLLAGGGLGRLVPTGKVDELAEAMAAAAAEGPRDVEAMRAMAARFTVERSAPAYLAVMRAAIGAGRAAAAGPPGLDPASAPAE